MQKPAPRSSEEFATPREISAWPTALQDIRLSPPLAGATGVIVQTKVTIFVDEFGRVPRVDVVDADQLPEGVVLALQSAIAEASFAPAEVKGMPVKAAVPFMATLRDGHVVLEPQLAD